MWQVDNDRYQLWRLEYELGPKPIDRLLDSATASDRTEAENLLRRVAKALASVTHRFFGLFRAPSISAHVARRVPE